MKVLERGPDGWCYELDQREALYLRALLHKFPVTANQAAKITKTDPDPKAAEREHLLNASLAEHREKLKVQARGLIAADKLTAEANHWQLRLDPEARETLLQILNDIRVGSWHSLGEPENLSSLGTALSEKDLPYRALMEMAGYFEFRLLDMNEYGETGLES
jgi:hypothetical protein